MKKEIEKPEEDFAEASVVLPCSAEIIFSFIQNLERLFRLNPHLQINSWQEDARAKIFSGKQIRLDTLNEMNGLHQQLLMTLNEVPAERSFSLKYDNGLKQATCFSVQPLTATSSRLVIRELYPAEISVAEKEARLNEVDRSLVPWANAIHSYFTHRTRWAWLPFFNWWRGTFWLGMTPRHRRITRMIIWTTALEFVVFLFVFIIYWLELGRGVL